MQDISQELYEDIRETFVKRKDADPYSRQVMKKIKDESATLEDCSLYARRLGEIASETLIDRLDEGKLPNGTLYWNIAEKTILPLMKLVHSMVNEAAMTIQQRIDAADGIGIKAEPGDFPEERAKALLQKIVDMSMKEIDEE